MPLVGRTPTGSFRPVCLVHGPSSARIHGRKLVDRSPHHTTASGVTSLPSLSLFQSCVLPWCVRM